MTRNSRGALCMNSPFSIVHMRLIETEGHSRHLSTAREMSKRPLHEANRNRGPSQLKYSFWGKRPKYRIGLPQTGKKCRGSSTLCVVEIRANFTYNLCKKVEDAYSFHDPCLSSGDAPLSLYASYVLNAPL